MAASLLHIPASFVHIIRLRRWVTVRVTHSSSPAAVVAAFGSKGVSFLVADTVQDVGVIKMGLWNRMWTQSGSDWYVN